MAQDYISGLHDCFELLAEHQTWGSDYSFIFSGLKRYEYRSHAIYYQPNEEGILIVRVFGGKQDPAIHM